VLAALASWAESAELEILQRAAALCDQLARRIETALITEDEVGNPAASPADASAALT
jgi:hypothetical protein